MGGKEINQVVFIKRVAYGRRRLQTGFDSPGKWCVWQAIVTYTLVD